MVEQLRKMFLGSMIDGPEFKVVHDPFYSPDEQVYASWERDNAVIMQGRQLFDYMMNKLDYLKVDGAPYKSDIVSLPDGLRPIGERLVAKAKVFVGTTDRMVVREAASAVDQDFSLSKMVDMFTAIMADSTRVDEDAVALFFFCLDLTQTAFKSQSESLQQMALRCQEIMAATIIPRVSELGPLAQALTLASTLMTSRPRLAAAVPVAVHAGVAAYGALMAYCSGKDGTNTMAQNISQNDRNIE